MSVSWHGCTSVPKPMHGGGPQGASIGNLEYCSLSNHSADIVDPQDRFKFIDDLSCLEIVNLLSVGMSSFNPKLQVPSDILENNQYIPNENLKSQSFLNSINDWTKVNEMLINIQKSK